LNKESTDCQNNFRQLLQYYGYNPKDFDTGAAFLLYAQSPLVHGYPLGKKTTTEVFQLFHNFKEQVRSPLYDSSFSPAPHNPLQVRACGAITKAAAAKDGSASRSQSTPAAAGTGKKIAGHSGGDGDPMVFSTLFSTSFLRATHLSLGQTHCRHQSRQDGRCKVNAVFDPLEVSVVNVGIVSRKHIAPGPILHSILLIKRLTQQYSRPVNHSLPTVLLFFAFRSARSPKTAAA
jgi:hypothetical protein